MVTFGNFLTLAEKNLSKGDKEFFFISRARSTAKTHSHKKAITTQLAKKSLLFRESRACKNKIDTPALDPDPRIFREINIALRISLRVSIVHFLYKFQNAEFQN